MTIQGNWNEAKKSLEQMSPPKITDIDKSYVCIDLPPILGYQVQYVRYVWKTKPMKHWLVVFNHKLNMCYVNNFEEIGSETYKKLF